MTNTYRFIMIATFGYVDKVHVHNCYKNKQYVKIMKELMNKFLIVCECDFLFVLGNFLNCKISNIFEVILCPFITIICIYLFILIRMDKWMIDLF
jgi:hypothetical protein